MSNRSTETKVPVRQNLVKEYRPIGPGAIAGAVIAMTMRTPSTKRSASSIWRSESRQ